MILLTVDFSTANEKSKEYIASLVARDSTVNVKISAVGIAFRNLDLIYIRLFLPTPVEYSGKIRTYIGCVGRNHFKKLQKSDCHLKKKSLRFTKKFLFNQVWSSMFRTIQKQLYRAII